MDIKELIIEKSIPPADFETLQYIVKNVFEEELANTIYYDRGHTMDGGETWDFDIIEYDFSESIDINDYRDSLPRKDAGYEDNTFFYYLNNLSELIIDDYTQAKKYQMNLESMGKTEELY